MEKKQIFLEYLREIPNFLSIFLYPVFLISISPVLIDISSDLGFNLENLNLVLSFLIAGNITGQLTASFFSIKFSRYFVIIFSYIVLIPLTVSLFFLTELYLFYIVYLFCGYILGVIWIQANGFLLESKIENKNRLINIALIFFPIGAIIAPLLSIIISSLGLNWRYLYGVILFFVVVIFVLYFFMKRKSAHIKIIKEDTRGFKGIFINRKYNLIFVLSVLSLFFYGISETVIYTWSPTYFRIDSGLEVQLAGLSVTIFWIAVTIGRIVIGIILCRIKPYLMAFWLSLFSLVSLAFMIFLGRGYWILVAVFFVGLGYSGLFSLIFSTACLIYQKGKGILETILFVATGLGASLAPYLTGLAFRVDLQLSISISMIFMFLLAILIIANVFAYRRFVKDQNVC